MALGGLLTAIAACGAPSESVDDTTGGSAVADPLVFASVSSGEAADFREQWGPFTRALSVELARDVELFQAADYAGVIEAQIAGMVDIARYGAFSYVLAQANGAEIELAGVTQADPGVDPEYTVYGLARADSDIESLEQLRGRTVCFPDAASTSTLIPQLALARIGIDSQEAVEPLTISSSSTIPSTIVAGDCEAGFVGDAGYENALSSGEVRRDQLRVIWSERGPESPIAVRAALPSETKDAIRAAVLTINADFLEAENYCDGDECRLGADRDFGFVPVEDSYFDVIREACRVTDSAACASIN
jgi:phosphonate transport system substrate-binding protein